MYTLGGVVVKCAMDLYATGFYKQVLHMLLKGKITIEDKFCFLSLCYPAISRLYEPLLRERITSTILELVQYNNSALLGKKSDRGGVRKVENFLRDS